MQKTKINQALGYREQTGGCDRQGWRVGEMGKGGQKVQTSSYKISKSWGCDVQHDDYS